jgi:hypothetical protein
MALPPSRAAPWLCLLTARAISADSFGIIGPVKSYGPMKGASPESPEAGWATDLAKHQVPDVLGGSIRITGESRAYLVQDVTQSFWKDHKYVRVNMQDHPLRFTIDLAEVPCGCLACVYLVAMKDPTDGDSQYCDMAENVRPGYGNGLCTELDILEVCRPQIKRHNGSLSLAHLWLTPLSYTVCMRL